MARLQPARKGGGSSAVGGEGLLIRFYDGISRSCGRFLMQHRGKYTKGIRVGLKMKVKWPFFIGFCICLIAGASSVDYVSAQTLFEGRRIHLSNNDKRVFSIGVTGTTAGYNYLALIENAKQQSISLGDLGYWELVPDSPSFLRNHDLQLIVKNNSRGKFQIEFEYDTRKRNIDYRIKKGAIQVKIDGSSYYPTLIIDSVASVSASYDADAMRRGAKRILFFDFNSFDVDLRKYYGSVKRLLNNPDDSHYFYYYESGNYNSYYFKTYESVAKLDTDKMGLSLEDGTLEYYQKVLDNLKSLFGSELAGQVIIVSRFGDKFSTELKNYAYDIGVSRNMVTFRSYEDIK